ncbi:hypothetical protein Lser_V15G41487 [Lactuca serriola]
MNRPTKDDLDKMESDVIAFYEISCGVAPDNFDVIINCKSAKEIWDVLKNLYEGSEQAKDKKLTTALNEFNNFKAHPGESLEDSFKRLNLIFTKLSNVGTVQSNHETNLKFLNGLGKHWTTAKMIVHEDKKIYTLSLFKLYGELQTQESTVLKDCADFRGPLALIAQTTQKKTTQSFDNYSLAYDNPPQSYEADTEYDDDEEFQKTIALCNKENHFAKDCKANMVKDKSFYLRMVQEMEEKEKARAYVDQIKRDHQV